MKIPLLLSLALTLCAVAAPADSQTGAQTRRTVHRTGDWYVVRSTHQTTGDVICTGFYMGHGGVQLSKDNLIIKTPGELQSIGLRFGNEPALALRPPAKAEQQIGAVMLQGADFEHLRRSKTLGLDITTSQGHGRHTLNLGGLDAALRNINQGCPAPAVVDRADRRAERTRERVLKARCAPDAVARMRAGGVPEWRITSNCPNAEPPPAAK